VRVAEAAEQRQRDNAGNQDGDDPGANGRLPIGEEDELLRYIYQQGGTDRGAGGESQIAGQVLTAADDGAENPLQGLGMSIENRADAAAPEASGAPAPTKKYSLGVFSHQPVNKLAMAHRAVRMKTGTAGRVWRHEYYVCKSINLLLASELIHTQEMYCF
jgi:hypothetical protein